MNISILIPTKDRSFFVLRLIHYYEILGFKGEIFILDSSNKFHAEKIINAIKNSVINIKYFHSIGYPGMIMKKFLSEVKTDYVVETGDDDFLIIKGLKKLISFLDKNLNYSGANGKCISILSQTNINQIDGYSYYKMCGISEENPLLRFKKQCENYVVPVFSVFRKDIFKKIINQVPNYENKEICPDREIVDELIQSFFSAIYSRIFHMQTLYLVRHISQIRNELREEITKNSKKKELVEKSRKFLEESIYNVLKSNNNDYDLSISIKNSIDNYYKNKVKSSKKSTLILLKNKLKNILIRLYSIKHIKSVDYKQIENIILNYKEDF